MKSLITLFLLAASGALLFSSCTSPGPTRSVANTNAAPEIASANYDLEPTVYLAQNWTPGDREDFYHRPQGSHIMPMKFAEALRRPDDGQPFFTSHNLQRYGFIGQNPDPKLNPLGLPIGFTVDGPMQFSIQDRQSVPNGERMLGVTCALCHTATLHYGGKAIRIDGGQTLANFQTFVRDMDMALKLTYEDQKKLEQFVDEVLVIENKDKGDSHLRDDVTSQLRETLNIRGDWTMLNGDATHQYGHGYNDTDFQYGPARIDAFNVIFNQVLARDLQEPKNASKADDPVSPPVIWDAPQADFLQWNGLASNAQSEGGPIARNIGEVLGVFGQIDLKDQTHILNGYCSTGRRGDLETIETTVTKLWSPPWPEEILGKLDSQKVQYGKYLFFGGNGTDGYKCSHCHQEINRTDPYRKIISKLVPMKAVGTDPKFDYNALGRMAYSDYLEGHYTRLKQGRQLGPYEPASTVLKHAVAGAIAGSISVLDCKSSIDITGTDVLESWTAAAKLAFAKPAALDPDEIADPTLRAQAMAKTLAVYKARPLNGIWSSPPFLHNGSVASLYDLMSPPEDRKNFYLGCSDFDPVKVGLNCRAGDDSFMFDTAISGNQPIGHNFGPQDNDPKANEKRMALIEYLKSL